MVAEVVYGLCAATSAACAWLLYRAYRRNRVPLLFWSALCFVGLLVNNVLLFVDLVLLPRTDLSIARALTALAGISLFVYGAIWETD